MNRNLTLRRLDDSDSIHELTLLLHVAYKELADMGLNYSAASQDDEVTRQRIKAGECWVAVQEGKLVGTITFVPPSQTGGCWWYGRLYVAKWYQFAVSPACRRLGIGTMLLNIAERRAVECGASELAGDTAIQAKHLITMYQKKGFRIVQYIGWLSENYGSVVLSKRVGEGIARTKWYDSVIEKWLMLHGSRLTCACARRRDGAKRLWARVLLNAGVVRILERAGFLSVLRRIRVWRNIRPDMSGVKEEGR